jgi:hypothetical protein
MSKEPTMMIPRIFAATVLAAISLIVAGCGCPELTTGPIQDPRVYNQTITEFNPGWNPPADPLDPTDPGTPVARFSIGTFEFPANSASSGNYPNDPRFSNGRGIVLDTEPFKDGGKSYTVQLVNRSPDNSDLLGDILVVSVDLTSNPRTAHLRFSGNLFLFPDQLNSGSATAFIDYIKQYAHTEAQLQTLRGSAMPYGLTLASTSPASLDTIVVDSLGREVAGIPIPTDTRSKLSTSQVSISYDVTVEIGQVYYYIAKNGVEFAIHIEDIFEGSLAPNQRRVTIKFAALHGPQRCDQ